jgi:hypothetical protein
MRRALLVLVGLVVVTAAVLVPSWRLAAQRGPHAVSLVQLIATPEKYQGKPVQVFGFMRLEHEGTAIYLHREDYENSLYKNGLWLTNVDTADHHAKHNLKWVLLEGTFDGTAHGHLGLWSGTIKDIKRVELWGTSAPRNRR